MNINLFVVIEDEYRNKCIAKCAGESVQNCIQRTCDSSDSGDSSEYGAGIMGVIGQSDTQQTVGLAQYGFNINTVLLAAILLQWLYLFVFTINMQILHNLKQVHYDSDQ